jgi:hypothetical protein
MRYNYTLMWVGNSDELVLSVNRELHHVSI